jgi:hypothetical protein
VVLVEPSACRPSSLSTMSTSRRKGSSPWIFRVAADRVDGYHRSWRTRSLADGASHSSTALRHRKPLSRQVVLSSPRRAHAGRDGPRECMASNVDARKVLLRALALSRSCEHMNGLGHPVAHREEMKRTRCGRSRAGLPVPLYPCLLPRCLTSSPPSGRALRMELATKVRPKVVSRLS